MRNVRDPFAKDLLEVVLAPHGGVRQDALIPGTDAQRADVRFVPRRGARRAHGLLGRMARGPCLFEPFSDAPSADDLLACMRKLLTWRHLRAKRRLRGEVLAWALCAGRPSDALATLAMRPTPRWPTGVYGAGFPLRVVVLDELPRAARTIPLRRLEGAEPRRGTHPRDGRDAPASRAHRRRARAPRSAHRPRWTRRRPRPSALPRRRGPRAMDRGEAPPRELNARRRGTELTFRDRPIEREAIPAPLREAVPARIAQ